MNLAKIIRIFLLFIAAVLIILLSAALILEDRVSGIILNTVNRNLTSRIDVGSIRLSFIRSFPRASFEMKNVLIHTSKGFDTADFSTGTDTLLYAESAFIVLRPLELYKGKHNIENISVKSGRINLLSDKNRKTSYDVRWGNNNNEGAEANIDLEKISLENVSVLYINKADDFTIGGLIEDGRLKSSINGNKNKLNARAEVIFNHIATGSIAVTSPVEAETDLSFVSGSEGIVFGKSTLSISNNDFSVEGSVSSGNVYDLTITGDNADISRLSAFMPVKYREVISAYDMKGKIMLNCIIKGPASSTKKPHTEITFSLQNGHISSSGSKTSIDNISFDGSYSNGWKNSLLTSSLSLRNILIHLGSSDYKGSILIKNFNDPVTELIFKGRVYPKEVKDFFNIHNLILAEGTLDADLKIITNHRFNDSLTINDFIEVEKSGMLIFNNLSFGFSKPKLIVRNISGDILVSDILSTPGIEFEYAGQKIRMKGEFSNLPEWLEGKPVIFSATGDVSFDRFLPEVFFPAENDENLSRPVHFPEDMNLDINFRIDSLRYKKFASSALSGSLTYKAKLLTVKSLNLNTLDGAISGNGFIVQNSNSAFVSRGDFIIKHINVNNAFGTFNNFGQSFIMQDNLSGSLDGNISLLLPLTSTFRPKPKEMAAEGKYTLLNGALINFEPVKKLSSFAEVSELENIHFERLENDFYIRNNFFVIPQMNVKSSAADLTVSGKHGFDNNYEYHVKVLLSQVLSRKRKSVKRQVTEFGAIKDDGLGRTSLLLKIENKGDDVKVSYDIKAVGTQINQNIKSEKQSLKAILNEEYGWYNQETKENNPPQQTKKNRFNITWEESDSTHAETPVKEEKEKGFRNLFRKK
ncbi:MAG TPA: AsmA-like C-terminal region-containing protein [Bacteroidales bacterium]|nr:AsmA-like C-terminal region-containing protein [Bacteroidales bacterium]